MAFTRKQRLGRWEAVCFIIAATWWLAGVVAFTEPLPPFWNELGRLVMWNAYFIPVFVITGIMLLVKAARTND